jgi:tyrosine-protein kinase Etk/Wzc
MTAPAAIENRVVENVGDEPRSNFTDAHPDGIENSSAETSMDIRQERRDPSGEIRLLDLLIILCRGKRTVARATLASTVIAAVIVLLVPARYTATTTFLPPQQSPSLASAMIGQMGALGSVASLAQKDLGLKNPGDLYVGMLRSRVVEEALVRRFDLASVYRDKKMSDARRDFEKAAVITQGKEGLVSIAVEDRSPSRAAQIANAYVDELRHLTQDLAVTEAGQRRIFFEHQLDLANARLADAEQALKATEQRTGVIELDGQAKIILESVVKLRGSIAAKEVELDAMRLSSTERNPDLERGEQQLTAMRAQLARLEKQDSWSDRASVSPGSLPAGDVPEAGLQYVRRLRDVKYAETIFELLAKQYEAARLDEARTAAVIQVLDPAVEPDRKSWPPRTLIVALATGLGLVGSCGWVLAVEAFHRMHSRPEVAVRWRILRTSLSDSVLRSSLSERQS